MVPSPRQRGRDYGRFSVYLPKHATVDLDGQRQAVLRLLQARLLSPEVDAQLTATLHLIAAATDAIREQTREGGDDAR